MPFNDPISPKSTTNQGDIKKTPEERAKQPPKGGLYEQVMIIDGKPVVVTLPNTVVAREATKRAIRRSMERLTDIAMVAAGF